MQNSGQGTMHSDKCPPPSFPLWNLCALPQYSRSSIHTEACGWPHCLCLAGSEPEEWDQEAHFCCTLKPRSLGSALPGTKIFKFSSQNLDLLSLELGMYWVAQKVHYFFHTMALIAFSCLELHSNRILLDCIVTAVMSACIWKTISKLVNFCVAILKLKMEENIQHFWCMML